MAHTVVYSEDWRRLPWKIIQRNVFRLQRRNLRERIAFLSRTPERREAHPQLTTTVVALLVGALFSGTASNPRQSREKHPRD